MNDKKSAAYVHDVHVIASNTDSISLTCMFV